MGSVPYLCSIPMRRMVFDSKVLGVGRVEYWDKHSRGGRGPCKEASVNSTIVKTTWVSK